MHSSNHSSLHAFIHLYIHLSTQEHGVGGYPTAGQQYSVPQEARSTHLHPGKESDFVNTGRIKTRG